MDLLLARGGKINTFNNDGETFIGLCVMHNKWTCIDKAIEHGAVRWQEGWSPVPPLALGSIPRAIGR